MNVLHISSEVAPYSKTGGLGDVASALPRAQAALGRTHGDRVFVCSPAYRVDAARFGLARKLSPLAVPLGGRTHEVSILEGRLPGGGGEVRAFLVDHDVFRRDGLYGDANGDWPDNAFRFALLSRAALAIAEAYGLAPDVIHGHDWQTGPAFVYARSEAAAPAIRPARTVFTIHNLAFQGLFPREVAPVLDLETLDGAPLLVDERARSFDQLSFIKCGLAFADRITTVSPRYAREIQTAEYGCGLDEFLGSRAARLSGILNGADYAEWNPRRDPWLAEPYGVPAGEKGADQDAAASLAGKRVCKAALQRSVGLPERPRTPLFGLVSRLTDQKGADLVCELLERIVATRDLQLALLGSGDPQIEARLQALAQAHPHKVAVRIGYDEPLAHRIYGGSDLFLMPSRWEPCGLGQLYAMRYGAVPVVRATGGLDDTVIDYEPKSDTGTGFKFTAATTDALEAAVVRAAALYSHEARFQSLARRAMAQDFSWTTSAKGYRALYESLITRPPR